MAGEFLNRPDVGAILEQMGRGESPNCRDNFNAALREIDFQPGRPARPPQPLPELAVIDLAGHIEIRESPAKPGDFVVLRALEDLVVVVTACSVDRGVLNGGEPKELSLEVHE